MFDVCVIGHITKDVIRIGDTDKEIPGGTAYYATIAMKRLGLNVAVVTKIGEKDKALLDSIESEKIPIFLGESSGTTIFTNIYLSGVDERKQLVSEIAAPFTIDDVEGIESKMFHFGPLTRNDIPLEILLSLSNRSRISLDAQGFLRSIDQSSGEVTITDWEEKEEFLSFVNVIKVDEDEARVISGEEELEKMAVKLFSYGPEEVIITRGDKGSLIYCKSKLYWISSFAPGKLVDPTGCGDTYMAGYLYCGTRTNNLRKIGEFAARTATLKLENYGPLQRIGCDSALEKGVQSGTSS